jgi:signal transduction histidine kinase
MALLDNDVEHNPRNEKHVWVELAERDDGDVITMADNGKGIPDSQKERLFDILQRHCGIDLYQSRLTVDNCGGQFPVQDRVLGSPNKGEKFAIRLPRAFQVASGRKTMNP